MDSIFLGLGLASCSMDFPLCHCSRSLIQRLGLVNFSSLTLTSWTTYPSFVALPERSKRSGVGGGTSFCLTVERRLLRWYSTAKRTLLSLSLCGRSSSRI